MRRWPLLSAATACLKPILASAGRTYAPDDNRRDGDSPLTPPGNIDIDSRADRLWSGGAVVWLAVGFALAGVGMFIGLLIFLSGHRHFQQTRGVNRPSRCGRLLPAQPAGWYTLCIAPVFFATSCMENNWSGYAGHCSVLRGGNSSPVLWLALLNTVAPCGKSFVNDHRHSSGSMQQGRKFDQFVYRPFCQPPLAEHDRPHRIAPVGQCDCGDGGGRGAGVAEQPERERPLGAARLA